MASHFHLFGVVLARFFFLQFSIVDSKMVQRSALCRSRRELSNEYLLAKFGFDTVENGPCKVCPLSAYRSPRYEVPLHNAESLAHEEIASKYLVEFEYLPSTTCETEKRLAWFRVRSVGVKADSGFTSRLRTIRYKNR